MGDISAAIARPLQAGAVHSFIRQGNKGDWITGGVTTFSRVIRIPLSTALTRHLEAMVPVSQRRACSLTLSCHFNSSRSLQILETDPSRACFYPGLTTDDTTGGEGFPPPSTIYLTSHAPSPVLVLVGSESTDGLVSCLC